MANKPEVVARVLELEKRNGELADLSRAEVIAHLCKIIESEGKEKTADRLKAVEVFVQDDRLE